MEVSSAEDFGGAFKEAIKASSTAIAVTASPFSFSNQRQITELTVKNRLPAMYADGEFVASGGLMSYGVNQADAYRRLAVMVDKILKGAKPADLPVEQPTKFELVINLKTAKQIGLIIPQSMLYRADKVIK
jgi:putative tryptophan/tyrosine transport system substrate-binding protein